MNILIFIPTITWSIPVETVKSLLFMDSWWHNISFSTTSRVLIHSARNLAMNDVVMKDYDYLLFLDDDNPTYNRNFLIDLLEAKKDIITWVYRLRWKEWLSVYKIVEDEKWVPNYVPYNKEELDTQEEVFEIDWTSGWCLLISKKVCQEMVDKYYGSAFENWLVEYYKTEAWTFKEFTMKNFLWGHKPDKELLLFTRDMSEDLIFSERAKDLWFKIYCHKNVKCYHIWKEKLLEV